jgi:hypothetical protein
LAVLPFRSEAPLPTGARAPTAEQVPTIWRHRSQSGPAAGAEDVAPWALALPGDWCTRGNWIGALGNSAAVCAAMGAPFDHNWGDEMSRFQIDVRIGDNRSPNDRVRYWVDTLDTADARALQNRLDGGRRLAEWDDHGESYPATHAGPSLLIDLTIPDGCWRVSLYFLNIDGHTGANNRKRDYVVTVKPLSATDREFEQAPTLASARIRDFWGGMHQTFLLTGRHKYTIRIDDNWSFNTICSGLFIDREVSPVTAAAPRYYFGVNNPDGSIALVDADEIDISQIDAAARPWLELLPHLRELRTRQAGAQEAWARRLYGYALLGLRREVVAAPRTLPEVKYQMRLRRALAECYEALRRGEEKERMLKEERALCPVARPPQ